MDFKTINNENYEAYALQHYNNPQCSGIKEFESDLNDRPKWIKRLLKKYDDGGELRELLILNHIIGFYNTFGIEPGTKLLFFKLDEDLYSYLKTFIIYLNYYNKNLVIENIDMESIPLDEKIIKRLREIQ